MLRNSIRSAVGIALGLFLVGSTTSRADEVATSGKTPTGSAPATGATSARRIEAGREQFVRVRPQVKMQADASHRTERFFNAQSCAECHKLGGIGGAGPNENNVDLISSPFETAARRIIGPPGDKLKEAHRAFWDRATPKAPPPAGMMFGFYDTPERFIHVGNDSVRILHRKSSMPGYDEWRLALLRNLAPHRFEPKKDSRIEATSKAGVVVASAAETLAAGESGGMRRRMLELRAGSPIEERNTPPLFGLGLIAKISQDDIDAIAAGQSSMFKGRAPRLQTGGQGRFGWKSQTATLAGFNDGACAAELGLRTEKFAPTERLTARASSNEDPEVKYTLAPVVDMTADDLDALNVYIEELPRPQQVIPKERDRYVKSGEHLFKNTGCAVCHVPDVGEVVGLYSDLLIHSVGTAGSASYGGFNAPVGSNFDVVQATEFRTPPLWGVADSGPYLHDGSAATLDDAIRRHTGQADLARQAYVQLNDIERLLLLEFLGTLRAPGSLSQKLLNDGK